MCFCGSNDLSKVFQHLPHRNSCASAPCPKAFHVTDATSLMRKQMIARKIVLYNSSNI